MHRHVVPVFLSGHASKIECTCFTVEQVHKRDTVEPEIDSPNIDTDIL